MPIKSILCIFSGSQKELNALNTALILGKTYGSCINFLHISPDPASYAALGYGEPFATATLMETCEKENQENLENAKQHIASFCARHGVPLDQSESSAHHASARFEHIVGNLSRIIAEAGRLCDLIVIGHNISKVNSVDYSTIIAALFDTGRPVLLMPPAKDVIHEQWQDKTVSIAWDGGLEASRALFNAFPLIEKTEDLHLIVVREHNKSMDLQAQKKTIEYLDKHGFKTDAIVIDRQDKPIGEVILKKAKELKTNLLVIGAYGHNRLREMILGGVTDYILENADIPLLLSH